MRAKAKTHKNAASLWIMAFAVVSAVVLLSISFAGQFGPDFEAETSASLSERVSVITDDPSASNNTYIQFNEPDLPPPTGDIQTINFSPSSGEVVNPERGFHHAWETDASGSSFPSFGVDGRTRGGGKTLARVVVRLDNYRSSGIDQAFLNRYSAMFASARDVGIKLTIRHTYNIPNAANGWTCPPGGEPDAPLSLVQQHIRELGPVLRENSDVIASIQGGFAGAWGEWHCSQNNLTSPEGMIGISTAMLQELPEQITFMVRTPMQKEVIVGTDQAMPASDAFSGSARSRLGHVNDCYLSNANDTGTFEPFSKIEYWKQYIGDESLYLPVGGETCFTTEGPGTWGCDTARFENQRQGWDFMNLDWYGPIIDSWQTNGCYNEFRDRLGYRYSLEQVRVSTSATAGSAMSFSFDVNNSGYSPAYNRRPVFLVLEGAGGVFPIEVRDSPAHTWLPGERTSVTTNLLVPNRVPAGSYDLALWLPDFHESIRSRSEYSIELANPNVWDPANGWNDLGASIQIN